MGRDIVGFGLSLRPIVVHVHDAGGWYEERIWALGIFRGAPQSFKRGLSENTLAPQYNTIDTYEVSTLMLLWRAKTLRHVRGGWNATFSNRRNSRNACSSTQSGLQSVQSHSLAVDPSLDGAEASRQADNGNGAGGRK